jgi:small subunit ribosomal protein S6
MEEKVLKKYEAIFILDVRKVEDEGEAFTKEFAALIGELGGKMEESVAMGRHQFASEIEKRKAGIYWNYIFQVKPEKIDVIRDKFHLDEKVVRNMIINYDRPAVVKNIRLE